MPDFGLHVHGPDGSLLIGNGWQNLFYVGKPGYWTTYLDGFGHAQHAYLAPQFTDAGNPPVVFYNLPTGTAEMFARLYWNTSYNQWCVTFYGASGMPNPDIYLFKRSGLMQQSTELYGLRVYHSDGNLVYDSGFAGKDLQVRGLSIIANVVSGASAPIPSGTVKPAVLFKNQYFRATAGYNWGIYGLATRFDSAAITLVEINTWVLSGSKYRNAYQTDNPPNMPMVFIDGAHYD